MRSGTIKTLISIGTLSLLISSQGHTAPQDQGSWTAGLLLPVSGSSILTSQGSILTIDDEAIDVWNPELGVGAESHSTVALEERIFQPSVISIPETDNILITGYNSSTFIFNPQTNSFSEAAASEFIWNSQTLTALPSGEILSTGWNTSNAAFPEIYSPNTNQWRTLTGAQILGLTANADDSISPNQWITPSGNIFGFTSNGFGNKLYYIDPAGSGSFNSFSGADWEFFVSRAPKTVMYQPGKLYLSRGSIDGDAPLLIDITGPIPNITRTAASREYGVSYVDSPIMLPNGKVLNIAYINNRAFNGTYRERLEIWDPVANNWLEMSPPLIDAANNRLSDITLMKDGRVYTEGYYIPAQRSETHAQIFSPPYLYNSAGQLAERPSIVDAPQKATYRNKIQVTHGAGDAISRVTLIKMGENQRFFELGFDSTSNGVSVQLPASSYVAPPGHYLMYLLDSEGVPSEGHILHLSESSQENAYPVAITDVGTSVNGVAITLDVLSNDTGSSLSLVSVNDWSQQGGRASISANKITYTPKAGFSGNDVFWYVMQDSQGRRNSAKVTVSVTVGQTDVYPKANPDNISIMGGDSITIRALANDISSSGFLLNPPNPWSLEGGKVSLSGDASLSGNAIIYQPKNGFNGTDKIWYTFRDSQGRVSNTAEITIIVTRNLGYPTAKPDYVTTTTGIETTIDVLANDFGTDLVLNAPNAWSLNGGRVSLVSNKLVYTSKSGFTGNDKIWYVFKDSRGLTNSGQVNITVEDPSAFPIANEDNYTTPKNTGIELDILANDIASSSKSIDNLYSYTAKGGWTNRMTAGKVWYKPKPGFTGEDNFWYVMIDAQGRKNSALVKINVTP